MNERKVIAAAVMDANGVIYPGTYHGTAIDRALQCGAAKIQGYSDPSWDVQFYVGFVTLGWEFLTREQAFERAKELLDIPGDYELKDPDNGIHTNELL